jgi:hypothetical protein
VLERAKTVRALDRAATEIGGLMGRTGAPRHLLTLERSWLSAVNKLYFTMEKHQQKKVSINGKLAWKELNLLINQTVLIDPLLASVQPDMRQKRSS